MRTILLTLAALLLLAGCDAGSLGQVRKAVTSVKETSSDLNETVTNVTGAATNITDTLNPCGEDQDKEKRRGNQ